MNFDYTSSIWVEPTDLKEMINRVAKGEDFKEVFFDIAADWEDEYYYNADLIIDQVREYVEGEVKKIKRV